MTYHGSVSYDTKGIDTQQTESLGVPGYQF